MVCCSLGGPAWTQLVAFPVGVLEWDLVWFLEWPGKIQEIHQNRHGNFYDRCRELESERIVLFCNGRLNHHMCLLPIVCFRIFAPFLCSFHQPQALCDWGAPDWIHLLVLDLAQVPWSAALMQELVLGLEQAFPLAQAPPENECNSAYDAHCLPIHSSSILWENKTHKGQFRLDIPHFRKKPKNHSHLLHTCH